MEQIWEALRAVYPAGVCSLRWEGEPWRLLVLGMLSAQCTDARVNEVSVPLFARYPTVAAMAAGDVAEIGGIIRPLGLWRGKAENLHRSACILSAEYGGQVPASREALLRLPGVGRKIANLVLGDAFGIPGIVADTHCIRIGGRLGFYPETLRDPLRVERILEKAIPPAEQTAFCHRLVLFGRDTCTARAPRCADCPCAVRALCRHARLT